MLFALLHWVKARIAQPVTCAEAKLIRRRQDCSGSRMAIPRRWFLTFCLEPDGREIEFQVSREEFDRIQVGAKGPLAYQGTKYISFRK